MRVLKISLFVLLAATILLTAAVNADVVVLKDGRTLKGKVTRKTIGGEEFIIVKTRFGDQKFPAAEVDKVLTRKDLDELYKKKVAENKPESADDHFRLGEWCEDYELDEKAKEHYREALKLNPAHEPSKKKLGLDRKKTEKAEKKDDPPKKEEKETEKGAEGEEKKENPLFDNSEKPYWDKKKKQEKSKMPPFLVKLPSKDWVFIDVDAHKADIRQRIQNNRNNAAKSLQQAKDPAQRQKLEKYIADCDASLDKLEKNYTYRKVHLFHKESCANLYFFVYPKNVLGTMKLDDVLAQVRKNITESGSLLLEDKKMAYRKKLANRMVQKTENKSLKTKIRIFRIDCMTDTHLYTISIECPEKNWEILEKDLRKNLKKLDSYVKF